MLVTDRPRSSMFMMESVQLLGPSDFTARRQPCRSSLRSRRSLSRAKWASGWARSGSVRMARRWRRPPSVAVLVAAPRGRRFRERRLVRGDASGA